MDAAAGLSMAPGSGYSIPVLAGIPSRIEIGFGEQLAARVAAAFVRAGVAKPVDWPASKGKPIEFLERSLRRFLEDHGAAEIDENCDISVLLSTSLNQYSQRRAQDRDDARLYLTVEPVAAGYVVLGPASRLLEASDSRLPAAFVRLFIGALNRWARVWSWQDAAERIERIREWYETDPDEVEPLDLPDILEAVPKCLQNGPMLPVAGVRRLLPAIRDHKARELLASALELDRISRSAVRPELSEEGRSELYDCGEPLPTLLAVFERGDAIEGQFDEEAREMMDVGPEPNLVVVIDGDDPASVRKAFATLSACCRTLACASRLIRQMPGNGAWAKEQKTV